MIAIARKTVPTKSPANRDGKFLKMLPQIQEQGRIAFRGLRPDAQEDMIQEVVCNSFVAYLRLLERGLAHLAFATPLANFAIKQVRAGRRVGNKMNVRDITSSHCQIFKGVTI